MLLMRQQADHLSAADVVAVDEEPLVPDLPPALTWRPVPDLAAMASEAVGSADGWRSWLSTTVVVGAVGSGGCRRWW